MNFRPLEPETSALPSCATSRYAILQEKSTLTLLFQRREKKGQFLIPQFGFICGRVKKNTPSCLFCKCFLLIHKQQYKSTPTLLCQRRKQSRDKKRVFLSERPFKGMRLTMPYFIFFSISAAYATLWGRTALIFLSCASFAGSFSLEILLCSSA